VSGYKNLAQNSKPKDDCYSAGPCRLPTHVYMKT